MTTFQSIKFHPRATHPIAECNFRLLLTCCAAFEWPRLGAATRGGGGGGGGDAVCVVPAGYLLLRRAVGRGMPRSRAAGARARRLVLYVYRSTGLNAYRDDDDEEAADTTSGQSTERPTGATRDETKTAAARRHAFKTS